MICIIPKATKEATVFNKAIITADTICLQRLVTSIKTEFTETAFQHFSPLFLRMNTEPSGEAILTPKQLTLGNELKN